MDNQNSQKVDYSKLPPELVKKLTEAEKRSPQYQQLQAIQDIADMVQTLLTDLSDDKKQDKAAQDKFGALLTDMRTSLAELNNKETPEAPDFSTPVITALNRLEVALTQELKKIDVSPRVQVGAPNVTVPKIDLSGIQKLLKTEIPKAFKEAISLIPEPEPIDNKPLLDQLSLMSEQLASIDVGTRLIPEPGNMKVTNLDGSVVGINFIPAQYDDIQLSSYDGNGIPATIVFKSSGNTVATLTLSTSGGNVTEILRT